MHSQQYLRLKRLLLPRSKPSLHIYITLSTLLRHCQLAALRKTSNFALLLSTCYLTRTGNFASLLWAYYFTTTSPKFRKLRLEQQPYIYTHHKVHVTSLSHPQPLTSFLVLKPSSNPQPMSPIVGAENFFHWKLFMPSPCEVRVRMALGKSQPPHSPTCPLSGV